MAINTKPMSQQNIAVSIKQVTVQQNTNLNSALLWQPENHKHAGQLSAFSKIMAEHINGKELPGKASHPLVNSVIRHDLKN
ncbi:hypothetical protein [Thalassomonas actiniarum]|uniref:Uncharacterized protein n=1 Tax=Thalassomonas actiniarum TaxID=485447 RepID=A0AAF0C6B6_9GAMM|nr:hypothetical protein [Thalassomonas actiniarum]WDE02071.1 hypothetical protein SG35_016260 [Thalassomonas actiniarum]